ncbi:MAG: prepilin peptidase [Ignavibacteriales bacterium]
MSGYFIAKIILLVIILGLSVYYDVKEQKIKNIVTMPGALLGLILNGTENGWNGLCFSFWGWVVPTLVLMILYYIHVMGAGDIKLYAAIGAIMGLEFAAWSFVFSVFAAGPAALFLLVKRGLFKEKMGRVFDYFKYLIMFRDIQPYSAKDDKSSKFIFSTAIAAGTLIQLGITILRIKGVTVFGG